MSRNIKYFFLIQLIILSNKIQSQTSYTQTQKENDSVKFSMVNTLKELNENGNPLNYYHWNEKLANYYQSQISKVAPKEKIIYWYEYCQELLKSGNNERCIDEIENLIIRQNFSYKDLINKDLLPIIELLALAYLRLGEVTNCQNNHNAYSCILPLRSEAYHIETNGSNKAIEIYSLIYEKFPSEKYKWLLNVAHMTVGGYPNDVPKKYFINYPNWDREKKDFPYLRR